MTRTRWAVVVVIAATVAWYATLPPAPAVLAVPADQVVPIRGVVHVHTRRSDGSGTLDDVARAAARAGLQFVIVTDHGDGSRPPEPPSYRSGVLCLDAVEITTNSGHLVAIGMPQAPYPLGGEARDVVEDVHRLGGLAFAAHPDSARASLRWTNWEVPLDGVEWLSADSEWRDEGWATLVRSLLAYPVRGPAALAMLFDRPVDTLSRWDVMTVTRRVVGVAASDAHARIGGATRQAAGRLALPLPSYEQIFRTLSLTLPGVRLTGGAAEDGRAVLEALRLGHVYSTIDGLATPGLMTFTARSGEERAEGGDSLGVNGPIEIAVRVNPPGNSRIVLLRNGQEAAHSSGPLLEFGGPPEPSVYRVEVRLPTAPGSPPVPWIVSNPIYVGLNAPPPTKTEGPAASPRPLYPDGPDGHWFVEKSDRSEGRVDVVAAVDGMQLLLRYGLGGTRSESPYVAAVSQVGESGISIDALSFVGRAARPGRLSAQVRTADGRRWRRSIYLDETARHVRILLDDMTPVAPAEGRPPHNAIQDVLFVIDTVNTAPGSSGQFWLDEIGVD